MAARVKSVKGRSAKLMRYLVYISDVKLQMFLDQIDEKARLSIATELKIDFKLISLKLAAETDAALRERSKAAKLELVESYLKRNHHVGDLTARHGYIAARAEMDWAPLDDNETVLFCGYAGRLLIVLGGSIGHLSGHSRMSTHKGSHPSTIRSAVFRGENASDLGDDLESAAREICSAPQPLEFLARIITRGTLSGGSQHAEYLLATPLYVQAVDSVGPDAGST